MNLSFPGARPKISFLRPVSRENFANALGQTCIHDLRLRLKWTNTASEAGYDEYSLLYSTRDFFPLLVPYSEILLLGRVASNGNKEHQRLKIGCRQHTCNIFLYHLDIIRFLK